MWLPNWKFCRVWGSNPGQTMADFFFGLFVGFLDFLVAPFSRFWYYISVQWSKMYLKRVILLIAWFGHIYDHCDMGISRSYPRHFFSFTSTNNIILCRNEGIHMINFIEKKKCCLNIFPHIYNQNINDYYIS